MFIVIDWIDWSWKWTQIKLIYEKLISMWKTVKILDYPRYWEKSAFAVEKYLNWEYWNYIPPKLASMFYAIDRYDSSFEVKDSLDKYDFILSNRYVSASMLHQTWKIKWEKETIEFLNWLEDLEYNIYSIPKPDKVIFLDVHPDIAQELVLKKEKREYLKWWKKRDLHEDDKNHLLNAYNKAQFVVNYYSDWVKVECVKNWKILPIEEITKLILKEII